MVRLQSKITDGKESQVSNNWWVNYCNAGYDLNSSIVNRIPSFSIANIMAAYLNKIYSIVVEYLKNDPI
jgi:hypothetical protein